MKSLTTEQHGTDDNKFFTCPDFWECDCQKDFIHKRDVLVWGSCSQCGKDEESSPDARLDDIMQAINKSIVVFNCKTTFIRNIFAISESTHY